MVRLDGLLVAFALLVAGDLCDCDLLLSITLALRAELGRGLFAKDDPGRFGSLLNRGFDSFGLVRGPLIRSFGLEPGCLRLQDQRFVDGAASEQSSDSCQRGE